VKATQCLWAFSDKTVEYSWDLRRDPNFLEKIGELAEVRAPRLLELGAASGWAGLYDLAPDHNAIMGEWEGVSRFLYATGFSGHGFLQGPAIGEILRDMYLGKTPFVDITPLEQRSLLIWWRTSPRKEHRLILMSALSQWLKPSRTVPTTSWSASGSMWKAKPKTFFYLMLGNWLYGTGEAILIKADIGQSPGTVLAQGIQNITGDTIGWTSFYISIGVMFLWIPLKNKVGIGTVLNIIFVSVAIDVMMPFFPSPDSYAVSVVMVIIGILVIGLRQRFLYPKQLRTRVHVMA
jgi:hypothetical protein